MLLRPACEAGRVLAALAVRDQHAEVEGLGARAGVAAELRGADVQGLPELRAAGHLRHAVQRPVDGRQVARDGDLAPGVGGELRHPDVDSVGGRGVDLGEGLDDALRRPLLGAPRGAGDGGRGVQEEHRLQRRAHRAGALGDHGPALRDEAWREGHGHQRDEQPQRRQGSERLLQPLPPQEALLDPHLGLGALPLRREDDAVAVEERAGGEALEAPVVQQPDLLAMLSLLLRCICLYSKAHIVLFVRLNIIVYILLSSYDLARRPSGPPSWPSRR